MSNETFIEIIEWHNTDEHASHHASGADPKTLNEDDLSPLDYPDNNDYAIHAALVNNDKGLNKLIIWTDDVQLSLHDVFGDDVIDVDGCHNAIKPQAVYRLPEREWKLDEEATNHGQ